MGSAVYAVCLHELSECNFPGWKIYWPVSLCLTLCFQKEENLVFESHTHNYTYACMHRYIQHEGVHTHTHTCTCAYTRCAHTYTQNHAEHMHVYTYNTNACTHTCIHKYIHHKCTHTYTHAFIHILASNINSWVYQHSFIFIPVLVYKLFNAQHVQKRQSL